MTQWNEFILYSCGHPCLRVWVGGFRPYLAMDTFCPAHQFIPPKNCPWQGGLWENSPAGKHSQLSDLKGQSMLPEWTNPKLFFQPYGHPGLAFSTPDHCKAKASKTTNERSVGSHFSFSHVSLFDSCCAETVCCSLSLFDFGSVFGVLVCRLRRIVTRVLGLRS